MRSFLAGLLLVSMGVHCVALAGVKESTSEAEPLPFGIYPHISKIQGTSDAQKKNSLGKEIQKLSTQVKDTVKSIASHRNTSCFGDPCLVQAFPLVYNLIDSGFFGGFRVKLTDVKRPNPYLYSVEASLIRSDTQQWLVFAASDFPKIEFLPLQPRLKTRLSYSRTTDTRYYGTGNNFDLDFAIPERDVRFALVEQSVQNSLVMPIVKLQSQHVSLFASFYSAKNSPKPYGNPDDSKLVQDNPTGLDGGITTRLGGGFLIDSRDQEILSRQGWALEAAVERAAPPLGRYKFHRFTLIDRRYFSRGRFTLASRTSLDSLHGDPPFWELTSIGGIDPIVDVNRSTILRGFPNGRFHEKLKFIESAELRVHFQARRIIGLLTQITLIPAGIDLASLSNQTTGGLTAGIKFIFNRTLMVQSYLSASKGYWNGYVEFGQDF